MEAKEDNLYDVEQEFTKSWSDPNWFRSFPLHHNSVYDYFCQCDFFDNQCNNNIVANQQLLNFEEQLKSLKGTEYQVDFDTQRSKAQTNPTEYTSYLAIFKLNRLSPKQTELQRIYYCPGAENHPQFGSIFVMPQINTVFNNKMRNATYHLNKAMDLIIDRKKETKSKQDKKETKKDEKKNEVKQNQYSSLVAGLIQSL